MICHVPHHVVKNKKKFGYLTRIVAVWMTASSVAVSPEISTRVTLIENFASNAAVQKLVDVKPDRTSPEIL